MKKIFIILTLLIFALPTFAVCSVTGGACSPDWNSPLTQRYVPNRLEQIQKTDAFQPKYIKPYEDMLINTEAPTNDYNSNCQFGVCLPGGNAGGNQ